MSETEKPRSHEERDVDVVWVSLSGVVLLGVIAVSLVVMLKVFNVFRTEDMRAPRTAERQVPPEPRLQANPREDIDAMRQTEEEQLHSYGWINRETGIVRLPIERAMTLLLQRGLPVRQDEAARKPEP